jgi:hypothetical protein
MGSPMSDPSNDEFAVKIEGWNKLTKRLHLWNYVVDFGQPLQSFPNYYVMEPL